jgi:hypothetical protein
MPIVDQARVPSTLRILASRSIVYPKILQYEAMKAEELHRLAFLLHTHDTDPRPSKY